MLVRDCIRAGYRDGNIIVIGEAPTDDENAEALDRLNDFRVKLFGSEFGENLEDWPVPPVASQAALIPADLVSPDLSFTYYLVPRTNSRLLVNVGANTTIQFPVQPNDGSRMFLIDIASASVDLTLDGNGRKVEGQPTLVDTPQAFNGVQWFYRADLASWERVETLALDSDLPLPPEYNDLFITYLAIRMAGRHSVKPTAETVEVFKALSKQAKARYRQTQPVAVADPRIAESSTSFGDTGARDWYV